MLKGTFFGGNNVVYCTIPVLLLLRALIHGLWTTYSTLWTVGGRRTSQWVGNAN